MSNIGDSDNSDLQRIREVNQAALRRKVDAEKRGHQARVERSFKEVMADRGREKMAQQAQRQAPRTTPTRTATGRVLEQVRAQNQNNLTDLAKKAALSRSSAGHLAKGRAKGHRTDALVADSRADQMLTQGTEELDFVQETARDEDVRDLRTTEEKQAELIAEGRHDGPIHRDGERRRQQRDGASGDDGPSAEGVQKTESPARRPVQVPPALIQQIVSAVFKAVSADGRTQMQIHLRGGPLDGVKLEVKSENGQVECTFHGCNREMEGLLKEGRPALVQGLAKRGLKLKSLNVA